MLNKLTRYFLAATAALFIFGLGYRIGSSQTIAHISGSDSTANSKNIDFSLFWNVWARLENKYVDKNKVDSQKLYYGAIKGMVASLGDQYTFFLTPDENKETKDDLKGNFSGIGAQLGMKDSIIMISSVLKNSPALNAGLMARDIITKVDGKDITGSTLPEVVSKIRGPKGTKVKITIFRNGKQLDFDITRQEITVSPVELSYEQSVAILKLNKFGDDADPDWDAAISQVTQKWQNGEIKGLVVDLRGNPGGYLQSAVYIASEFLSEGKLVVRQVYGTGEKQDYTVERHGKLLDIPVVILIDEGSASASEIVAGSLHDYGRATLVGKKSYGKGSVQEAMDLDQGAGLHVTVAKWILPKGEWINHIGINPDITADITVKEGNTMTRADDTQLDKAIEKVLN